MLFQILSHAGLLVSGSGINLVCDPWLVGSAYWRSWWNYPPVPRWLVESLKPDFIYLTHIHWDHFQGPSLRRFSRDTPVLVPKGGCTRMSRDLRQLGFLNIIEMWHGETIQLAPNFSLTTYHFSPFTDSAAMLQCEGYTLFNVNDAKFMGGPLEQILKRHPKVDFVFRSHSSANARLCQEFIDAPSSPADDGSRYARDFADFALKVGARYAIPFASNHCYLHKEVFHLNPSIVTPSLVQEHFQGRGILKPELKIMVSGDLWCSQSGFAIAESPYLRERERCLEAYRCEKASALEAHYAREARASVSLMQMQRYFEDFFRALPYLIRRIYKGKPVTYILTGSEITCFIVDLHLGMVAKVPTPEGSKHPLHVHTSAYIVRHCLSLKMMHLMGISKRLRFRSRRADAKYLLLLEMIYTAYENDLFPLKRLISLRFLGIWLPRWREILLYARILVRLGLGQRFLMGDYLRVPPKGSQPSALHHGLLAPGIPKAGSGDGQGAQAPDPTPILSPFGRKSGAGGAIP